MPDYYWDPQSRHYYYEDDEDEDGTPERHDVSRGDLRKWLVALLLLLGKRLKKTAEQLQAGEITVDEWHRQMSDEIRNAHLAAAMLAAGGLTQMTPERWANVAAVIRRQEEYLDAFAAGVASGAVALDGRFPLRAAMYADAGWSTFESFLRDGEIEGGENNLERRVLDPAADHCSDCVEFAAQGWQPIGTLPEIGESQCNVRCRCEFEYSTAGAL